MLAIDGVFVYRISLSYWRRGKEKTRIQSKEGKGTKIMKEEKNKEVAWKGRGGFDGWDECVYVEQDSMSVNWLCVKLNKFVIKRWKKRRKHTSGRGYLGGQRRYLAPCGRGYVSRGRSCPGGCSPSTMMPPARTPMSVLAGSICQQNKSWKVAVSDDGTDWFQILIVQMYKKRRHGLLPRPTMVRRGAWY